MRTPGLVMVTLRVLSASTRKLLLLGLAIRSLQVASSQRRMCAYFLIVAAAASAVPKSKALETASSQAGARVTVVVLYPDSAEVADAAVSLWRNDTLVGRARADERGQVEFHGLGEGHYRVQAEVPGFATANADLRLWSDTKTVYAAVQMKEHAVTTVLSPLVGRVVKPDGEALVGVFVCAHAPLQACNTTLTTLTDSDGSFRFDVPVDSPYVITVLGSRHLGTGSSPSPYTGPNREPLKIVAVSR